MGTEHLKARCVCDIDSVTGDLASTRGCPLHDMPAVVGIARGSIPAIDDFDVVQKPRHYNSHESGIQAIEIGRHLTADWFNAFKYIFRCDLKNGRQDIEKALWYANDSVAYRIPMRAASWGNTQVEKINRVIHHEPDPLKKRFYCSVRDGHVKWARDQIEEMLT